MPEDTQKNWNRTSWFLTTVIMDSGHCNILLADNDFNENMIIIKTCFALLSHDMVQNNFTNIQLKIENLVNSVNCQIVNDIVEHYNNINSNNYSL